MTARSLLVFLVILASVSASFGQDYKRVRIGIGVGLALPQGSNGTPGWVASLEPGFRLSNNFLIGVKAETAMLARGMSRNLIVVNPTVQLISGTIFTQVYLASNYVRPFLYGGVGYVMVEDEQLQVSFNGSSETLTIGQDQMQVTLRAGVEVWHFSVSADLTFGGDEKPTDFLEIKNSYVSLRLMVLIGGGLH